MSRIGLSQFKKFLPGHQKRCHFAEAVSVDPGFLGLFEYHGHMVFALGLAWISSALRNAPGSL